MDVLLHQSIAIFFLGAVVGSLTTLHPKIQRFHKLIAIFFLFAFVGSIFIRYPEAREWWFSFLKDIGSGVAVEVIAKGLNLI